MMQIIEGGDFDYSSAEAAVLFLLINIAKVMNKVLNFQKWAAISLFGFMVVSFLGMLMRYKIGFEFPFLNQKNIQHAHSHFAFNGWVTLGLMLLLIKFLDLKNPNESKRYRRLIAAQLVLSYLLLFLFGYGGYTPVSIGASTLTAVVFYWFSYRFYKDSASRSDSPARKWFLAGLALGILSTLATFGLAYLTASKQIDQHTYLALVYCFLHFQYNGWFLFALLGGVIYYFECRHHLRLPDGRMFNALAISVIPAYGLSVLWLNLPLFVQLLIGFFAFIQLLATVLFVQMILKTVRQLQTGLSPFIARLWIFAFAALLIKVSLQLFSVIPEISHLAFGFRPIVIAYLHLVLLAFVSVLLLSLLFGFDWLPGSTRSSGATYALLIGIGLNELVLALQGILSFDYIPLPAHREMLFAVSVFLFLALGYLFLTVRRSMRLQSLNTEHDKLVNR